MLDEGEDTIVLHVPWLTESLLQLLLHVLLAVQKINLRVLQQEIPSALHPSFCPENSGKCWSCCTFLEPHESGEGELTFPGVVPSQLPATNLSPQSPLSTATSRTNLF